MDRSNTGREEEDVRIRVQMGKCSFSSNLSRMEGNKVHKAEDFFKYRASKPSKEFSFADCRFTEQYCYRHHIQNVV